MQAVQEAARIRQAEAANDPVITHPIASKITKPKPVVAKKHKTRATVLTETAPLPVKLKIKSVPKPLVAPAVISHSVPEAAQPHLDKKPAPVHAQTPPQVSVIKKSPTEQRPESAKLPPIAPVEIPRRQDASEPQPQQEPQIIAVLTPVRLPASEAVTPLFPAIEYGEDFSLEQSGTVQLDGAFIEAAGDDKVLFESEGTLAEGFTAEPVENLAVETTAVPTNVFEIEEPAAIYLREYKEFAVVLRITGPIFNEQEALEIQPLPPVCVEVAAVMQELAPEPAEAAQEILQNIMIKIDEVVEQRISGSELAPASEEELEELCIGLFEYLGIEYTPEAVMEFVAGIMKTKKLSLEAEAVTPEHYDDGTHEIKLDDDQTPGRLAQLFNFPKVQKLAGIVIRFAA